MVEGPYLSDILEQPEAVVSTIGGLAESDAGAMAGLLRRRPFRRVVLTGMGSSLYALHPITLRLIERGHTAQMVETSELVHYQRGLLDAATLLIVVSQSGRSAETVRLLKLSRRRCFTIGVTNTADSPLGTQADVAVLTSAGAEFSVTCKTYVTALAALGWLGDVLCGRNPARTLSRLRQAPPAMRSYLAAWKRHVRFLRRTLEGVEHLFLAGRGASLAAASTGGLIVKEAAHFPAEGMSAAAFRHGPFEILDKHVLVLVFAGDAKTRESTLRLVTDIRNAGGRSELICEDATRSVFRLPARSLCPRPLMELLPVQMITLALAAMAGREPGRFERAAKITTRE